MKETTLTLGTELVLLASGVESLEAVVALEPFAPYAIKVQHAYGVHLPPTVHTANHPAKSQIR